jgi:CubicO group peptidase (beta-lactamase class C family)
MYSLRRRVTKIDQAVRAFMSKTNAPGVSLAVGVKGRLQLENGYGVADLENEVRARAATVYRLASVYKPITAVATMLLVERSQLTLDDTVGKWLPDLPPTLRPITLRQLLSHQSGIRHYTAEEDDSTKHYFQHYASLRDALAIFKDDPLVHAPGSQMAYSTYAYTLLGGTLLKPESFRQMTTMQGVPGKEDTFYGLGWIVGGWGGPGTPRVPGLAWHGGVQQRCHDDPIYA